jgi:hypothetical protein
LGLFLICARRALARSLSVKFQANFTVHLSKTRRRVNNETDQRDKAKANENFPKLGH